MTVLLDERFETGPDTATIDTTNSGFTAVGGTSTNGSRTFTSTGPHDGALCGKFTAGSTTGSMWGRYDLAAASSTIYLRQYVKFTGAFPSNGTGIGYLRNSGGTVLARLEVNSAGTFDIKNGTTLQATSTTTATLDQWCRLEWGLNAATGQELRIYVGANVEGTTPDETITGAFTATTGQQMLLGWGGNTANRTMYLDAVAIDNATWVGPLVSGGTPATVAAPAAVTTWGAAAALVTAAATILAPPAVATWTGPTGVVTGSATVAPPAGVATWTAAAPTVSGGTSAPVTVAAPAGTLTATAAAPTVTGAATVAAPAAESTWTAAAPTIAAGTAVAAPAGVWQATATAPAMTGAATVTAPAGSLTAAADPPTITAAVVLAPPAAVTSWAASAPMLIVGTVGTPVRNPVLTLATTDGTLTLTAPAATLTLTTPASTLELT